MTTSAAPYRDKCCNCAEELAELKTKTLKPEARWRKELRHCGVFDFFFLILGFASLVAAMDGLFALIIWTVHWAKTQ